MRECSLHEAQYVLAKVRSGHQLTTLAACILSQTCCLMVQLVNKRQVISKVRQVKLSTKQTVSDTLIS